MKSKMFQKVVSVFMVLVLFAMSLGVPSLTIPAYAEEAAPDPETEMAADPEAAPEMEAADPEAEAADIEAADPGAESAAADPAAESAADSLTGSGTEAAPVSAGEGKYVSDVFIAYGKSVEEAEKWLVANGWEPLPDTNNFNAGKASYWDDSVAASMGIRRTNDPEKAITDMAVMNMKGGYSFSDYRAVIEEKRVEIDEVINSLVPALEEYRANLNGSGSKLGKKRAELARTLLNKFYDGNPNDRYAANDTGLPIGELLSEPVKQEEGGENGGDLQQIILESSTEAVRALELCIVMASDTSEDTWLDRLPVISKENLSVNVGKYIPEAAGQDLPQSAITQFYQQEFGDTTVKLASQWQDINDRMLWYEDFNNEHDLWQHDDESDEDYEERYASVIQSLSDEAEEFDEELNTYSDYGILYWGLYEISFPGPWGETLGDFYNPAMQTPYQTQSLTYYPMAIALSKGQRRALDRVSLYSLLMIGLTNEKGIEAAFPNVEKMLGDAEAISIYSGINRGIFRDTVALTSAALMDKERGYDPYKDIFELASAYNTLCYVAAVLSVGTLAAGITSWAGASKIAEIVVNPQRTGQLIVNKAGQIVKSETGSMSVSTMQAKVTFYQTQVDKGNASLVEIASDTRMAEEAKTLGEDIAKYQTNIDKLEAEINKCTTQADTGVENMSKRVGRAGKILTCIGGALLIIAACVKGYQIYKYYQKEFTPIPRMIVDEADIVSYVDNGDGTSTKNIDFDQFVYYEAVRCNRDKKHKLSDWQEGVSDYEGWGCGDVADLNADQGQEWLALYTVKSLKKGYPILADSLTMQYGSDKQPEGTTRALHFFTFTHAADLGDMAYSYNNKKNGIYFFWDEDAAAYDVPAATASTFSSGQLAATGFGGLLLGILGATIVLYPRRKKVGA